MAKISERAIQMKANFMRLHDEGKTLTEIAEIYSLSRWTVYDHLQSIADENKDKVSSRDDLLERPHKTHELKNATLRMSREHVDIEEIRGLASDILSNIDKIVSKVDTILKEENIEH